MVKFTQTTLQKEGTLQSGDITYNVSLSIVNNELTRLYCGITQKKVTEQPDINGTTTPVEQDVNIGYILLDHGRQITEIALGENLISHLKQFQEILNEVTGDTDSTPTT